VTDSTFRLTAAAKARGWDAAFGGGVLHVAEDGQGGRGKTPRPGTVSGTDLLSVKEGRFGRGERACTSPTDLSVPVIRLAPVVTSAEDVAV
jgi:hypothetical protein